MYRILATICILLSVSALSAQTLHVNDDWDECSMLLDPTLTQEAWHQFTEEAGIVSYFRPLSSAKPLGVKNYEISILNWGTRIDAVDDAWNDTFSHPDSTHWLFDGSALFFPGLMFRMGITDRIDIGTYITKNPGANYGFYGGQIQYNLINDSTSNTAVAVRFGFNNLYGPADLNLVVYALIFWQAKIFHDFHHMRAFPDIYHTVKKPHLQ